MNIVFLVVSMVVGGKCKIIVNNYYESNLTCSVICAIRPNNIRRNGPSKNSLLWEVESSSEDVEASIFQVHEEQSRFMSANYKLNKHYYTI